MELRHLKTFLMVASVLNFTRAAAALGYAQSSVTAQIQALEEELGAVLFHRLGRSIRLTDAGQRFLGYAQRIMDLTEEARQAATSQEGISGRLTLGSVETVVTYYLPPVLKAFRRDYPQVVLTIRPTPVFELRRGIVEGTLDAAFILEPPLKTGGLWVEELAREPILIIAAPDNPLARKDKVRAVDLKGQQVLLTEAGCAYRNLFEKALIDGGAYPARALEFASIEAIKKCVMTNMGIAALPRVAVAQELEAGRLAALHWSGEDLGVAAQMVTHRKQAASPVLEAFIRVVREEFPGLGKGQGRGGGGPAPGGNQ